MGLDLHILGSSSLGNCGLLQVEECSFLIDAGFSGKKIAAKLSGLGVDFNTLTGVFLTHEHSDHIRGLKVLSRVPGIRFYANIETQQAIEARLDLNGNWQCLGMEAVAVEGLKVQPFAIQHDAVHPLGFLFSHQDSRLAWALDLGRITDSLVPYLIQADTLVIEANHDPELLWNHPRRPRALKARIAQSHLSNGETCAFVKRYQDEANWKVIYLAHGSQECNSLECLERAIHEAHLKPTVHIVPPG